MQGSELEHTRARHSAAKWDADLPFSALKEVIRPTTPKPAFWSESKIKHSSIQTFDARTPTFYHHPFLKEVLKDVF